jgi:hypothetical protein
MILSIASDIFVQQILSLDFHHQDMKLPDANLTAGVILPHRLTFSDEGVISKTRL